MSRKTRKIVGVLTCLIGGGWLVWMGTLGFPSSEYAHNYRYFFLLLGVLIFVFIPFGLRNIDRTEDKKDEMRAMLEDYRRRKNRP